MSVPELAVEIEYFEKNRNDLLVKHGVGKFVLIKGPELIGVFDTAENAYEEGATRFPGQPFLIQELQQEDLIQDIPAYYAGLLYAPI